MSLSRTFAAAIATLIAAITPSAQSAVVINEVAPGVGGANTAEFVELYNSGSQSVDLAGWTLAHRSRTGATDSGVLSLSGVVPAQSHFLITGGTYNEQAALTTPPLPAGDLEDATGAVVGNLTANNGQLGLRDASGVLMDAMGYWVDGSFTGTYVETAAKNTGGSFPSRRSLSRDASHTDTNNNDLDFTLPDTNTISPTNSRKGNGVNGMVVGTVPAPSPTPGIVPYLTLKNDPSVSIMVNWWNPQRKGDSRVEYGPTAAYGSIATVSGPTDFHHVELTELLPATQYHYRIRSTDGTIGDDLTFSTAAADATDFTFAVYGDTRGLDSVAESAPLHGRHKAECDHIAAKSPDFGIHTGDLVNQGSNASDWSHFFQAEKNLVGKIPVMMVIGNHELQPGGQPTYHYFDLFGPAQPANGTPGDAGYNFSFNYGNAHFVVLSSYKVDLTKQRDWLVADLAAAAANPAMRWVFAVMHAPLYTSSNSHAGDLDERALWGPVFDQYHVDMVFAGHNHIYERTHPIVNGAISAAGTIYITSGLGGGPFNQESTTPDSQYIADWHANETAATFITIRGDTLSLETITAQDRVVDSLALQSSRTPGGSRK